VRKHQIDSISTIEAMKSSSDVNLQPATEIMIKMFEDLRENRPKGLEESVLTSLKTHIVAVNFRWRGLSVHKRFKNNNLLNSGRLHKKQNNMSNYMN